MNETLNYKCFTGPVCFSQEDNVYYGKIDRIDSLVTYEADDRTGLQAAFEDSCESYLEACKKYNWPIFKNAKSKVAEHKPVKAQNAAHPAYV